MYFLSFCSEGPPHDEGFSLLETFNQIKENLSPFFEDIFVYTKRTLKLLPNSEDICNCYDEPLDQNPNVHLEGLVYAKTLNYWDYIMPDAVRITIQAKDLNTNFNQIIIPKNIAKDILNEMKLPMFGKMHPEKFHNKLVQYIDLSQDDTALVENIFEALTELEDLCTECISYESFLEWKVS